MKLRLKSVLAGTLCATIVMSGATTAFANEVKPATANVNSNAVYEIGTGFIIDGDENFIIDGDTDYVEIDLEPQTFDEFIKSFGIDGLSSEDKVALEKAYNEAAKLEKAEKYEEADKYWEQIFEIADKYWDDIVVDEDWEMPTFDELVKEFGIEDIAKEDRAAMEKAYNEAIKLEEAEKYEEADQQWDALFEVADKYWGDVDFEEEWEMPTFDELIEEFGIENITTEDKAVMEKAYNEAIKLEEAEKYEEADQQWDKLFEVADRYFDDIDFADEWEMPTFDELLNDFDIEDITKEDQAAMEKAYNEAIKLEEAEKYEEADQHWEAMFTIADKYFDEADFEEVEDIDFDDEWEMPTFDELIKEFGIEDVTKEDQAAMEKAYNEAIKLEEAEKYEEADQQWEKLFEVADKYFENMTFEDTDDM